MLDGLPWSKLGPCDLGKPLTSLLVDAGLAASGKQAKDALSRSAFWINGRAFGMEDNMAAHGCFARSLALFGRFFVARLGKHSHHLFVADDASSIE